MFELVLFERAGADFGHHELTWLLEVRIGEQESRRITAFDLQRLPMVPVGSRYAFQPVHCGKRRVIRPENLARDAHACARSVYEPRHVTLPYQVQGIGGAGLEGTGQPDSPIYGEVGKPFLQRSKDEYQVLHAMRLTPRFGLLVYLRETSVAIGKYQGFAVGLHKHVIRLFFNTCLNAVFRHCGVRAIEKKNIASVIFPAQYFSAWNDSSVLLQLQFSPSLEQLVIGIQRSSSVFSRNT